MQITVQHLHNETYSTPAAKTYLWTRFINWAAAQQHNRLIWTILGITSHACIFTVLTLMVIISTGTHFIFMPFAIAAIAMTVVTNLAALPTKITIPVFLFSVLIDLVIIALCIGMYLL